MNGLLKLSTRIQRTFASGVYQGHISARPGQSVSHFLGAVRNVKYFSSLEILSSSAEDDLYSGAVHTDRSKLDNPQFVVELPNPASSYDRQKSNETALGEMANSEQLKVWNNLKMLGRATSVKRAQDKISEWHYPLSCALQNEQKLINMEVSGVDRQVYGPYLTLVQPEKLAILALERVMNNLMSSDNQNVKSMKLALELGTAIENQVILDRVKGKDLTLNAKQFRQRSKVNFVKVQRVVKRQDPWSTDIKVKLGSVLLKTMIVTCLSEDNKKVFDSVMIVTHSTIPGGKSDHANYFKMTEEYYQNNFGDILSYVPPTYPPMLVPPRPWNNRENSGAYALLPAPLMKHISRKQTELSKKADMPSILEGLDYLGNVPWKINNQMLDVVTKVKELKLVIGEIQPEEKLPIPTYEQFFQSVLENPDQLRSKYYTPNVDNQEELVTQAKKFYKGLRMRLKKKNSEMHSLRCDINIKLSIARDFKSDTIYFPHNLDFRGRAYPVPPNLNHLGSDLCRSLLVFGNGVPLGERGLRWLKIHISNLCGFNKFSFDGRVEWVESQMSNIIASADDPFGGDMWWSKQESPFQVLAASKELVAALRSPNPIEFVSNFPVHQDGSCNGLQHYASLGRDYSGGKAVNLVDSETPQDVYTSVLDVVRRKMRAHAELVETPNENPKDTFRRVQANRVKDIVSRKVIKQTVMTSVYGVTYIGAKEQIKARLYEAFEVDPALLSYEADQEIFASATYLAGVTLESIGEVFSNAKKIMDWLATVSHMIAKAGQGVSWITPLGLPVLQPYKANSGFLVKTVLQTVCIASNVDSLPVNAAKQKSAFPPNFVHSLDATHMFITSLKMKKSGLFFAAVHDSYWTHPAHVDSMREHLRDSFVELYERPVLEDLRDSIVMRYPRLTIPPLPTPGLLDLKSVKSSTYFFH